MPNPDLPLQDHFARQSTGNKGHGFSDEQDGYRQPPWLHGRAFQPTPSNPNISGLWVEHIADTWERQLERVRDEFINSERTIRKSYQMAILQVQIIRELGRRFNRDLHVLHTPDHESKLQSHAEIRGIEPEDEVLQQRLADRALVEPIYTDQ